MSIILYKGHEWEPGEPCKHCGMRKEEIIDHPAQQCKGSKDHKPPSALAGTIVLCAIIQIATQLL